VSVAAAQYSKFKEQVVKEGKVFTVLEQGHPLIFRVHDHEAMPFWSSCSRLEKIQQAHPKYQNYQIAGYRFEQFLQWLPHLAKDDIHIGVNWSGPKLVGYDIPAQDLIDALTNQAGASVGA
jgi:hypothetical protein